MKYTLVLVLAMLFVSFSSYSQEETKKVVIIKKMKDENGKVTTEKVKASGAEADKLIEEMKKDGTLEGIDIEMVIEKAMEGSKKGTKTISKTSTEDIKIEKKIVNGKETTTYTITTNDDGKKEVIVWAGEGEMPAEMAEKIKLHEMHEIKTEGGQKMIIISDNDVTKVHKEVKIEIESPNKVTLGVMISDDEGVTIDDVIKDSVAEKAGLKTGDVILQINNDYTFNIDMLMKALSKFDKGDDCNVRYIRDGIEKTVDVKF
ncbi:MAG: membrane-associated protease RseP (regulator of RpoE activity) [Saprospiraceae bacterium]|jgi:membrane-associated protease RseP (regulator of RpoE activity)